MDCNFTKKAALLAVVGMAATTMSAQQLKKIGGNPYIIAPTAVFEIESADKGFLMPRITSQKRIDMATTAAEGLQVYDLDTKSVWIHNGTIWVNSLTNSLPSANLFVGDGNGVATGVALSGDVSILNTGAASIVNDAVITAKILNGNVTASKIEGLADAEFIVGLDGTSANNKKVTMSGDVTMTNAGLATIGDKKVVQAKLSPAVAGTVGQMLGTDGTDLKWVDGLTNSLPSANLFVGDANGVATGVALSGVVAIDNAGLTSIVDGTILAADIASDAVTTAKILNGTILAEDIAVGAVTTDKIAALNVTTDKIAALNITSGLLANEAVTTDKIAAANVTDAKLDKGNIPLSGFGAAAADVAFGGNNLTDVADPTLPQDAATKSYVDTASSKTAITADAKTAAYTALGTDYTILANTNGGTFTLTLPAAADNVGKVYVISKRDDGTNSLSFSPSLVMADGIAVSEMNYATTIRIQSNGTSWLIIN